MLRSSEALANFSIRALIRSLISDALIAMVAITSGVGQASA
jgi:hypothetical protein